MAKISCDYLVTGAGAMGLAFCDTMLNTCSKVAPDKRIVLIDRHSGPGGHWRDAYPFVTLHQPACFYGVESESLERNKDPYDLSTQQEVVTYFERVLAKLVATGRLQFFGESEYMGGTSFMTKSGDEVNVELRTGGKVVDATYTQSMVPSICPPKYDVDSSVTFFPVNGLGSLQLATDSRDFVIIGGGKTAMDAVVYLLRSKVEQQRIHWIVPNDSWVVRRRCLDPTRPDIPMNDYKIMQNAKDSEQMLLSSEETGGMFMRLDKEVAPRNFKYATLSEGEVQLLQSVKHVIRQGRLQAVGASEIAWQNGSPPWVYPAGKDMVFVDCSAHGLVGRPPKPIFEDGRITLQTTVVAQVCSSGAQIGWLECNARDMSDEQKSKIVIPCLHPCTVPDSVKTMLISVRNENFMQQIPGFSKWWQKCRLNGDSHAAPVSRCYMLPWICLISDMLKENGRLWSNLNRIFMREFSSAKPIALFPPKKGQPWPSMDELMSQAGAGMRE